MTPFWIINFLENDSCESFFQNYMDALIQNCEDAQNPPLKFFHITDGTEEQMTCRILNDIASMKLSTDVNDAKKLIPAFTRNQGNRINVFFIGDITKDKTIERFHTWATYLMKLRCEGQQWRTISEVKIYGILLRPEDTTVKDASLSNKVKGFLNELTTLERMDINHRPFSRVLFIQAPLDTDKRKTAENSAYLAAYHIARTDGMCFREDNNTDDNDNDRYYDTYSTAVFYEAKVQKEIDAYNLSVIMLKDFVDNKDEYFVNEKEARTFVDNNKDFTDGMKPISMKKFFVSGCPSVPNLNLENPYGNNLMKLWRNYDSRYIENTIKSIRKELEIFDKDFKNALYRHQWRFITDNAETLDKLVFQMFTDTTNSSFVHIGLQQCKKVLEHFKIKIKEAFNDTETTDVLRFPEWIDSQQDNSTSKEQLENILKESVENLPKFKKRLSVGVPVAGIVGGTILSFLFPIVGIISLPIILLVGLLIFMSKIKGIESLKKQYVGKILCELRDNLKSEMEKCVEKTQSELRQYIKRLRDKKLDWLITNMSVIAPPSFRLQVNDVLQPLSWNGQCDAKEKEYISINDIKGDLSNLMKAGSFGKEPITKDVPTTQIGTACTYDLMQDGRNKAIVQALEHELMKMEQNIVAGEEERVNFQRHESSIANRRMLLLLDVSGSMSGDMNDLKEYVKDLENVGEIEWIAFDDKVVATSRETEVESLAAGGGTCYIPAINKAAEWLEDDYDEIILLSDGYPFEKVDDIVNAANKLGQPVNTISIGASAEGVLTEIAFRTGGKEITVDSFDEIKSAEKWNSDILPKITLLENGTYPFGELMRRTQVEACAKALHEYALEKVNNSSMTISKLFDYINKEGFREWGESTSQLNELAQAHHAEAEKTYFASAKNAESDALSGKIKQLDPDAQVDSSEEQELILTRMLIRKLSSISDLLWAKSMKDGKSSINNPEKMKELIQDGYGFVNINGEKIELED